jgi:1-acyl-sn-glycerol-3-phosphate acyltransferase
VRSLRLQDTFHSCSYACAVTETLDEVETPAEESALERPDLLVSGTKLGALERFNIRVIRATFASRTLDATSRWLQRNVGARWIWICTRNILDVRGLDRVPNLAEARSFILVTNHRSYFDQYVVSMLMIRAGLQNRLMYPVRSNFFYDHPLGIFVNGAMSFLSMYPPVFRQKKHAVLNHVGLGEMKWFLDQRGFAIGVHPEGTRKKDDDPYTFLPAQSGVGRLIYHSRAPVLPAFINGLGNDLPKQIAGNFTGGGRKIIVVFGKPIDFGELLEAPPTGRTYRAVADHTIQAIGVLGQEEKAIRESAG